MEQNNRDDGGSSNKPPAPNNPGHQTSDEPPSGQPTMPTLESLASEPGRTHRTWIPKYGRIAKCDWCNNRGPGILMVCAHRRCSKYMCERCARSSTWHADPWHHIDADALDWTVKKIPRKTKTNRGSSHSQGDNGNDDGSEYRDDGEDEDDEEDTVYNIKGDRYRKKGAVKKVNNRGRRGNRVPGNAGVRTATRERTSRSNTPYPPEAGSFAPRASHGTHDHVVLDIYEFLYRQRPNLDPRRDYASPGPATAAAPYAPTSRTTPAYHPLNDRTPAEVEAFHQDNTLQQQMQYAWSAHPTLHGLRQDGRRLDAIGLLWDVFELRRARVWVPDNSRTVAWFVAERDSQFRIEHSARALTAAHQFSGYPGPGEAAGTVGHRHRLALGPARRGVEEDEEEEYR
ncbi:hypothetical protein C8A03DRAFT_11428 [Achaetomium macrosporum]|uniref:Uncharacterized protein n=1 Tax=Achaetomium macrosporum TaxID=79813 RepID=A0AAN7HA71_9PEZI|nr:hypothetical protein C8A03DRAFT_11428 [Achaetomium macrosporum]